MLFFDGGLGFVAVSKCTDLIYNLSKNRWSHKKIQCQVKILHQILLQIIIILLFTIRSIFGILTARI